MDKVVSSAAEEVAGIQLGARIAVGGWDRHHRILYAYRDRHTVADGGLPWRCDSAGGIALAPPTAGRCNLLGAATRQSTSAARRNLAKPNPVGPAS